MQFLPKTAYPTVLATLLSVAYGLFGYVVFRYDTQLLEDIFVLLSCSFILLLPFGLGALTGYLGGKEGKTSLRYAITAPWIPNLIFSLVLMLLAQEDVMCMVMVLPILLLMGSIGGIVFSRIGQKASRLNGVLLLGALSGPYVAAPLESQRPLPTAHTVTHTQIVIEAEPEAVWAAIESVPEIRPEEHRPNFFHTLGLPRPVAATLSHPGVGGVRDASFEDGLHFNETVTVWDENVRLGFTIEAVSRELLPTPLNMIGGEEFDVLYGEYQLEPQPDGTVILHLLSHHRLTTRFNSYGRFWTDWIMRDLQNYILEIIKNRIESDSGRSLGA